MTSLYYIIEQLAARWADFAINLSATFIVVILAF